MKLTTGDMRRAQGLTFARQEIDEALAACAWVLEAIESSVTIERLVAEHYQDAVVTASAKVMRERQELIDDVRDVMQNLNAGHDARDLNAQAVEGAYQPSERFDAWLTRETRPHNLVL